jgi:hypothetical protein
MKHPDALGAHGCCLPPTNDNRYTTSDILASRHAALYIFLSPTDPYTVNNAGGGISLLAMSDQGACGQMVQPGSGSGRTTRAGSSHSALLLRLGIGVVVVASLDGR